MESYGKWIRIGYVSTFSWGPKKKT